ncbi:hypothetical protein [Fluviispira multicolorata]|uniref:Signal transduction histidine kinase dimerisation/phosphoacceptor domain-containing protein n=1 Tax=Fluviispira multicolorata TaxID=2654512 RepID=A0A833N5B3_9BACT|nr:hypothetical protein [Fluviispira multicolorata]KAB8030002.1 hypothetical protein GCL57_10725 [Fluviispira multicolorata]
MSDTQTPESIVNMVSLRLRELIHDINNALFVTKGFLEELGEDVTEKKYLDPKFDHENFVDMISTITRNVEKIDQNLIKLRKFAKEEVFEKTGVTKQ